MRFLSLCSGIEAASAACIEEHTRSEYPPEARPKPEAEQPQ